MHREQLYQLGMCFTAQISQRAFCIAALVNKEIIIWSQIGRSVARARLIHIIRFPCCHCVFSEGGSYLHGGYVDDYYTCRHDLWVSGRKKRKRSIHLLLWQRFLEVPFKDLHLYMSLGCTVMRLPLTVTFSVGESPLFQRFSWSQDP